MSFFGDFSDPKDHPDTLILKIAGKEVPWLLNKTAFTIAKDEGIDLSRFSELGEDAEIGETMDAMADMVYIGTIPFREADYETPTREEVHEVWSARQQASAGQRIMALFNGLSDEEIEEIVGKG